MSPRFSATLLWGVLNVRSSPTSHYGPPDPLRECRAAAGGAALSRATLWDSGARCANRDRRGGGGAVEFVGRATGVGEADAGPGEYCRRPPRGGGGLLRRLPAGRCPSV